MYSNYKADAKRRGLEWLLTDEIFDCIVIQSCHYCGLEPSNRKTTHRNGGRKNRLRSGDFVYSGLDRVDNNKGYTIDNVVPCCKQCNRAKRDITLREFKMWIQRLMENTHAWI